MVEGVVVASWWVPDQVLGNWHFRLLLLWFLLFWLLLWGLLWSSWDVVKVMEVVVSMNHVSIVVHIVVNIMVNIVVMSI